MNKPDDRKEGERSALSSSIVHHGKEGEREVLVKNMSAVAFAAMAIWLSTFSGKDEKTVVEKPQSASVDTIGMLDEDREIVRQVRSFVDGLEGRPVRAALIDALSFIEGMGVEVDRNAMVDDRLWLESEVNRHLVSRNAYLVTPACVDHDAACFAVADIERASNTVISGDFGSKETKIYDLRLDNFEAASNKFVIPFGTTNTEGSDILLYTQKIEMLVDNAIDVGLIEEGERQAALRAARSSFIYHESEHIKQGLTFPKAAALQNQDLILEGLNLSIPLEGGGDYTVMPIKGNFTVLMFKELAAVGAEISTMTKDDVWLIDYFKTERTGDHPYYLVYSILSQFRYEEISELNAMGQRMHKMAMELLERLEGQL